MPRPLLRADWADGLQDIAKLAKRYDVSRAAMRVRLSQLGLLEPTPRCGGTPQDNDPSPGGGAGHDRRGRRARPKTALLYLRVSSDAQVRPTSTATACRCRPSATPARRKATDLGARVVERVRRARRVRRPPPGARPWRRMLTRLSPATSTTSSSTRSTGWPVSGPTTRSSWPRSRPPAPRWCRSRRTSTRRRAACCCTASWPRSPSSTP